MERLFSIIIPCYNAEGFIDRVMGSVMGQTLDPSLYEVIAVNDASTDKTLELLYHWADRYPDTIRVITYDNNLRKGGARNAAIRQASGEYVCFLDADDWMEKDALASFMTGVRDKRDIITAKFVESYEFSMHHDPYDEEAPVQKTFLPKDRNDLIRFELGYVWSSVYRKNMIKDNDVWFPEHLAYEDIYWQRLIKFYAQSACIIDRVTHHHYNHPESTMNKKNASHHIDRLTCYEMLLEEYEKRGLLGSFYPHILKDAIETYYFNSYYMFFRIMEDIPDVYLRIRSTIYRYFPEWEKDYDDRTIPMVFQYMLKLLRKATNVSPNDLIPFKDAMHDMAEE